MSQKVFIVQADLCREDHQRDVLALTAAYACDPMGNSGPLPAEVLDRLIVGLREHPTTLILLAYVDAVAAGLATCFLGFSTFAARPLVNVHDLAVLPEFRGQGIGRALLEAVQNEARQRGCIKVTLEVQEDNIRAKRIYQAAGFTQQTYSGTGGALFYSKKLA